MGPFPSLRAIFLKEFYFGPTEPPIFWVLGVPRCFKPFFFQAGYNLMEGGPSLKGSAFGCPNNVFFKILYPKGGKEKGEFGAKFFWRFCPGPISPRRRRGGFKRGDFYPAFGGKFWRAPFVRGV